MANTIKVELEIDKNGAIKSLGGFEGEAEKKGKKAGDNFEKGFGDGLKGIGGRLTQLAALAGSVFSVATIAKSIQAANEQAEAVERLNQQLRVTGEFTQAASDDFQEYAASLQDVTRFGDEVILNQLALAKSFGATNEQAKEVASVAADLAESFGIDIESATRNAAKTLGGYAGELGEVIPELKNLTREQLQAGEGIRLLQERFGGAGRDIDTFGFRATQLRNTFGDLLEEVGKFITESPEITVLLKSVTDSFRAAIGQVREFSQNFSFIDDLLVPLSNFGDSIITFVISPLELLNNIFGVVQSGLNIFVATIVAGFGKIAGAAADLISFFGGDSELVAGLNNFRDTSAEVFADVAREGQESISKVLDFPFSEQLTMKNEELRAGLEETKAIIDENAEQVAETNANTAANIAETAGQASEGIFGLQLVFSDASKNIANQTKQIAGIVKANLGRGISQGIQLLVNNLANGKNAFEGFGKFVLGVFGQLATQLGEFFIIQGIAVEALKSLGGAAAVAAGAALVALGAILSNAGGGSSSGGGAGAAGVNQDDFAGGLASPEAIAEAEPEERSVNQVVVQGDIFDTEETGLRLVEIISRESEKNGSVIIGGAVA